MAITVDWAAQIVYVPRADMTLVQTVPSEIRQLNLDTFRKELKALEASEAGAVWPDIHSHNTTVDIGGVTLARVISIINGYTVTFEDGQYAVNLSGANSNVGDVVNVNQVSVRSANSAGLVDTTLQNRLDYAGAIHLDQDDGVSGTAHPIGTSSNPVNNFADAVVLADTYNAQTILLTSSPTPIFLSVPVTGLAIKGKTAAAIVYMTGADVSGAKFENVYLAGHAGGTGSFDGEKVGLLNGVSGIRGTFTNGGIYGTVTLGPGNTAFKDTAGDIDINPALSSTILGDGTGPHVLGLFAHAGQVTLGNFRSGDQIYGWFNPGSAVLLDTITGGDFRIGGVGPPLEIEAGVVTDSINSEGFLAASSSAFAGVVWLDVTDGASGTEYPTGTYGQPVNNMTDAVTIATRVGAHTIKVAGVVSVTVPTSGLAIEASSSGATVVLGAGNEVTNTRFVRVFVTGAAFGGPWSGDFAGLADGLTGINGIFTGSMVAGKVYLNGDATFIDSFSGVPGQGAGEIDASGATNAQVQFRRYTGGLNLYGFEDGDVVSVDLLPGVVRLKSDITGGIFKIRGMGEPIEIDGSPTLVDSDGFLVCDSDLFTQISEDSKKSRQLLGNRQETIDTGSGVVLRTWDDDAVTVLEENTLTQDDGSDPDVTQGVAKRGAPS